MSNKRGLVTVIRSYGDENVSDAIVHGVVSAEMKRMQDERDFAKWCVNNYKRQRVEGEFCYDVSPTKGIVRFLEQVVGVIVLLNEERRAAHAGNR